MIQKELVYLFLDAGKRCYEGGEGKVLLHHNCRWKFVDTWKAQTLNSKEEVTIINRKYVWLENELSLLCKEGNKKTLNCCISRNCHLVKELINCCPNKVVQIHKPEANLDQVYVLNIFYDLLWNETLFLKKIIKMHIWMWGMSQRTLQ